MRELEAKLLQATQGEFAVGIIIVTLLTFVTLYYGFRFFSRLRMIEDLPTSTIRGAAQGFVELEGVAKMMEGEPILAPISGKPCVWFSYKVERKERNMLEKRHNSHWRTLDEGVSDNLFHLEDSTGLCVIDPDEAEVIPASSRTWYGSRERPEGWGGSSDLGGLASSFVGGGRRYRYTEKLISTGDPLYAMGAFVTMGGVDGHYPLAAEVRDLLASWKRQPEKLLNHFDFNKDGEIDRAEWQIVRKQATKQVEKMRHERNQQPELHVMKKPQEQHDHYLLSVIPQSKLRVHYLLKAVASLSAFILLLAGVTWALQFRSLF